MSVSVKFSSVIHLTVDNYYLRGFGLTCTPFLRWTSSTPAVSCDNCKTGDSFLQYPSGFLCDSSHRKAKNFHARLFAHIRKKFRMKVCISELCKENVDDTM